jgi:hypothetical protein
MNAACLEGCTEVSRQPRIGPLQREMIKAVRSRLQEWEDYEAGNESSTPGKAYGPCDRVADIIHDSRRSFSNGFRNPDFRVSDEQALDLLRRFKEDPEGKYFVI